MSLKKAPSEPLAPRPKKSQSGEMKVYGVNASRALWQNRASDIVRVYCSEALAKEFGPLLKWCATQRKAYHVVPDVELEKVSASVHHEGIVLIAREPKRLGDEELIARAETLPRVCPMLFLDNVANPHNIGSMMRISAHFGAPIAMGRAEDLPRLTPSAARMAEGGMEHVTLAGLEKPGATIERLKKAGYALIATAGDGDVDLYQAKLPPRAIIAVGNEVRGISASLRKAADMVVRIPGTGVVDSLNVAAAAGLVLGEHWRQHHAPKK